MRLTINLATRVYINAKRLNISIAIALTLLVLLLAFNISTIATGFGELSRLQKETAALETVKGAKSAVPEKEYQALLARIKFANDIIAKKTFNWLLLLDKLEGTVPDGVSLDSIDPDPKGAGLKLAGVARGFGNVRKFLENLEDSKFFTEIYLVSQSIGTNQKGIGFNITCKANYK
jgi:type IV pilus assembly protein PilN